MSLPLNVLVKELETPQSIAPVLRSIKLNIGDLHLQNKSDINHLVSRTINLIQSHSVYNKWFGVTILNVLIENYEILSTHGLKFINALIKVLETTNANTNIKLFTGTVESLNKLCQEIRGKPTLTREILTPKLPIIIQLYLNNIDLNQTLIIQSLTDIMSHHPNTFRPFGNKLNTRLIGLIKENFITFPVELKMAIARCYAFLPVIEKSEPENVWGTKLSNIINEIVDILNIFGDLIDINHDEELSKLLSNPEFRMNDNSGTASSPSQSPLRLLPYLQIDLSQPESLLQLSDNLEVLIYLLVGFITTDTKYCIKLPIGKLIGLVGIIFGFNTNLLPFKRDIREQPTKDLINSILMNVQNHALSIIDSLVFTYQNPVIMYMNDILAVLETAIPMDKRSINSSLVIKYEPFMTHLLSTTSNLIKLVQLYQEPQQLIRIVDMALLLVEPRVSLNTSNDHGTNGNSSNGGTKQKSKKKNTSAVPMADLLSHSHLFNSQIPFDTNKIVRSFVNSIITRTELPLTQYYKIMRYIIVETVNSINYSHNNNIPSELKDLLINAVIYPGFEKVSILPIVSHILGDDPLISVFNNPRFPPLPILIKGGGIDDNYQESEDESNEAAPTDLDSYKRPDIMSDISLKRTFDESHNDSNSGSTNDLGSHGDSGLPQETKKVKVEVVNSAPLEQEEEEDPQESSENVLKFKDSNDGDATMTEVSTYQTGSDKSDSTNTAGAADAATTTTTTTTSTTTNTTTRTTPTVTSTVPEQQSDNNQNDEDSDFEMPSIDINDDSEDE